MLNQSILQDTEILDDSIMDESNLAGLGEMGMCITVTRLTMCCPAGMGNPCASGSILSFKKSLKRRNLSFAFIDIQISFGIYQCNTCTVITAILKSLESLKQNGTRLTVSHIANNSAHKF